MIEAADLSAIIPVGGRHGDLAALYREYRSALAGVGRNIEFIFVLDGPRPKAVEQIEQLLRAGEKLTVIELTRQFGEATALDGGLPARLGPRHRDAARVLPGRGVRDRQARARAR